MIDPVAFESAIPVVNLTAKAYTVKKGSLVAVAAPAEEYCEVMPAEHTASGEPISNDVTDHLRSVIDGFSPGLTVAEKAKAEAFIRGYADLFSKSEFDIGRTNMVSHTIDTGQSKPFKQQLRKHPWAHQEVIDAHVEKMLETGVISQTVSPWSSNVVFVRKSSGELRFCVDFRQLNNLTVKDSYPLPRIDSCMDSLGGAKYFSTLDLRSGYWQVELDKQSSEKTAFVTRRGIYKFNVLAFGLSNAPAIFQRLMDLVLLGLNWQICLAFLDDVIVMSSTFEQHLDQLCQVFERLRGVNLKLNAGKCHLMQEKVKFLGSVISKDGIAPDPEKVRAVTEWPVPTDLKQVRGFVALASYYRKHIEHFADIARPLHRLSCKETPFVWGEEQQAAFEQLKLVLSTAPLVKAPLPEGLFTLDTDASDEGLGAALHQEQDRITVVIAYASRGLKKEERNYCTTRKELLAIVYGLKQFRSFLLGPTFLLRTDHAALTSLLKTPEPVGQQARWLDLLAEYSFKIQHRAGVQHRNADSLSHRPCDRQGRFEACKQCPKGQPSLYCPVDEVDVEDSRPTLVTTAVTTATRKPCRLFSATESPSPSGNTVSRGAAGNAEPVKRLEQLPLQSVVTPDAQVGHEELLPPSSAVISCAKVSRAEQFFHTNVAVPRAPASPLDQFPRQSPAVPVSCDTNPGQCCQSINAVQSPLEAQLPVATTDVSYSPRKRCFRGRRLRQKKTT